MKNKKSNSSPARSFEGAPPQPNDKPVLFFAGLLFILVSVAASLALVLEHLAGLALPGCGMGGGCARAAASVWGKVPGIGVPTSSVGLAYFLAVMIGWIASRGRAAAAFIWIVRIGMLITVGFLAVIAVQKFTCIYCLATHSGNLAFWIVVENSKSASRRSLPALASVSAVFAAAVAVLSVVEFQHQKSVLKQAEAERLETTRVIGEGQPQGDDRYARHSPPGGFTGRWRLGPENAPIRIVIFSDFQCRDCRAFEMQVRDVMANRTDISVSAKHFPLCADCNTHMAGNTMHPNACWAARAAEAAGILGGNDGFWRMHQWLFDRSGSFTDAELKAALPQLGFDVNQFIPLMTSRNTLAPVQADIDEGVALGLFFTPMVFINGVELRGIINNPTALSRTIAELETKNLPPGNPLQDKPPLAVGKTVGDWREQDARALPPKVREWSLGPQDAPIKVWVWGDYESTITAELNTVIRQAMAARNNIQYIYRQYPLDQSCNPGIPKTTSAAGCWSARAAEAAGSVGGNEAFWKMHDWLFANQSKFNDAALREAASSLGLDADALQAAMNSPAIQAALAQDIASGKAMIPQGVPTLYVNGKWVARWRLAEADILNLIFDEAAP